MKAGAGALAAVGPNSGIVYYASAIGYSAAPSAEWNCFSFIHTGFRSPPAELVAARCILGYMRNGPPGLAILRAGTSVLAITDLPSLTLD